MIQNTERSARLHRRLHRQVEALYQRHPELPASALEQFLKDREWTSLWTSQLQAQIDRAERHRLGIHYTEEKYLEKLCHSLFLKELWQAFEVARLDHAALVALQGKLCRLRFLDPACGCGHFLCFSYKALRQLELALLQAVQALGQPWQALPRLRLSQFYGIEIQSLACDLAQLSLLCIEAWMDEALKETLQAPELVEPPQEHARLFCRDALDLDWLGLEGVEALGFDYIIGNPPFLGARVMTAAQKRSLLAVFQGLHGAGDLDFVTAWYWKAAQMASLGKTKVAFVSTNSIVQGQHPALLWKRIFQDYALRIDFAYPSFRWQSAARAQASVHCVIVGFSKANKVPAPKALLFDEDDKAQEVELINAYLQAAPHIFIQSRSHALCDVPSMGIGNKPIDGGHYLFKAEEKEAFLAQEPAAAPYFKPWLGSEELLYGYQRYCLWLGDCTEAELETLPLCRARIEAVRQYRLASKSPSTRKLAERPTRFHVERRPKSAFIVVPRVSSERRRYVPFVYLSVEHWVSDSVHVIEGAELYHFAVLSSGLHMAWLRAICGRLGNGYRYSKDIVYNNFPWPEPSLDRKAPEAAAQAILAERAKHASLSLSRLYEPEQMPASLLAAHRQLDYEVLKLYGLHTEDSEATLLQALFQRHRRLCEAVDAACQSQDRPSP